MLIEVKGVGFKNKGAELMLHAILQKVSCEIPDANFVMRPKKNAPFEKRVELGLYQKFDFSKYGINWGRLSGRFLHERVKEYYGFKTENDIDVVLDASGLGYSDKWGVKAVKRSASDFKSMKKNGSTIIMLPQAFGPFTNPKFDQYLSKMYKYVDLIYAREKKSFDLFQSAVGDSAKMKIAPDFTSLVDPVITEKAAQRSNSICVIPNYRMIDKTSDEVSNKYIPFMVSLIEQLKIRGEEVFILIHEGKSDGSLAEQIVKEIKFNVEIVEEENPLAIKGIISKSKGVISSRFHGLVSALSTGVPSLATGWSHKYGLLFEDYGFVDGMLKVGMPARDIQAKLDYLTDREKNQNLSKLLKKRSNELKRKSEDMWREVINHIKQ